MPDERELAPFYAAAGEAMRRGLGAAHGSR